MTTGSSEDRVPEVRTYNLGDGTVWEVLRVYSNAVDVQVWFRGVRTHRRAPSFRAFWAVVDSAGG